MKVKLLVGIFFIIIMFPYIVNAYCRQSDKDVLKTGYILKQSMLRPIIKNYVKLALEGYLYIVQKEEGYYYKICDEKDQQEYFFTHWVETGNWVRIQEVRSINKINIKDYGIYRIQKLDNVFIVWEIKE